MRRQTSSNDTSPPCSTLSLNMPRCRPSSSRARILSTTFELHHRLRHRGLVGPVGRRASLLTDYIDGRQPRLSVGREVDNILEATLAVEEVAHPAETDEGQLLQHAVGDDLSALRARVLGLAHRCKNLNFLQQPGADTVSRRFGVAGALSRSGRARIEQELFSRFPLQGLASTSRVRWPE